MRSYDKARALADLAHLTEWARTNGRAEMFRRIVALRAIYDPTFRRRSEAA